MCHPHSVLSFNFNAAGKTLDIVRKSDATARGVHRLLFSSNCNQNKSWFLSAVLHLMSVHVWLPNMSGLDRLALIQLLHAKSQETLWSCNQSKAWQEGLVTLFTYVMVQTCLWFSGQTPKPKSISFHFFTLFPKSHFKAWLLDLKTVFACFVEFILFVSFKHHHIIIYHDYLLHLADNELIGRLIEHICTCTWPMSGPLSTFSGFPLTPVYVGVSSDQTS